MSAAKIIPFRSRALEGTDDMATKEETDRMLVEFLRKEREAEANGFTKAALHRGLLAIDGRFADHEKEDAKRHDEAMQAGYAHDRRISLLEANLASTEERLEEKIASTKSDIRELKPHVDKTRESLHDITEQDLQDQLAEQKSKHNKVVERNWQIVMAVILCIACGLVGAGLTKLGLSAH